MTPPILATLQWVETTETRHHFDTDVGKAIDEHCAAAGIPVPADEHWRAAEWSVPVGTELMDEATLEFMYDRRKPAPVLRVKLGARAFVLQVGWSDACGCETCHGKPPLSVLEVIQ